MVNRKFILVNKDGNGSDILVFSFILKEVQKK